MGHKGFEGLGGRKEKKKWAAGKKKKRGGKDGLRVDSFGLFCFFSTHNNQKQNQQK
jgi:hypothetical protein